MPGPTQTEHGVRLQFNRLSEDGDRAYYSVDINLPGEPVCTVAATLERSAVPTVTMPEELPDWVEPIVTAVARTVSKSARWPRRVTRWKPNPIATEQT